MGIELRGTAVEQLREIAQMAYGSNEGIKGGAGNIGMIGGHVVKFNTHWAERFGSVTSDMRASSDALKAKIEELVENAFKDIGIWNSDDPQIMADVKAILNESGKSLLERKVVVKVLNRVEEGLEHLKKTDENLDEVALNTKFDFSREAREVVSSKGLRTDFAAVEVRTREQVQAEDALWKPRATSDTETLARIKAHPSSVMEMDHEVRFNYNPAHRESIRAQMHSFSVDEATKAANDDTSRAALRSCMQDVARGFRFSANGVRFDVSPEEIPGARDNQELQDRFVEHMNRVFKRHDGTIDTKARDAFIQVAHQGLIMPLYGEFFAHSPDSEWPNALSTGAVGEHDVDVSRTDTPGVYRMRFLNKQSDFHVFMPMDREPVMVDNERMNSRVENQVEFTFNVDDDGHINVLDIPIARCTVDFSSKELDK